MFFATPDLCDDYPELVQVIEPMMANYGGRDAFGGEIVTVKCHSVWLRLETVGGGIGIVVRIFQIGT